MGIATPDELDAAISRKGQSLARLVLRRLTAAVKETYPEARTIRLSRNEVTGAYEVTRVTTHHNKTVWRRKADADLTGVFGVSGTQVASDASHYRVLAGARLHPVRQNKAGELAEYSIHLLRDRDAS